MKNKSDIAIIYINDKEEVKSRGMIEGAINVSLGTLYYKADQGVPEQLKGKKMQDRDKRIVMSCGVGLCVAICGKLLKNMGFKNVLLL